MQARLRSIILGVLGFLAGVMITLIFFSRGERPSTGRREAKSELKAFVPPALLPPSPSLREPKQEPPVDAATPLGTVERKYLSQPERDQRELLSFDEWTDFYAAIHALGISRFEAEECILRRLGKELSLTEEQRMRLVRLYYEEQQAVTEAVLAKYGRGILALTEMRGPQRQTAWEDLRSFREAVRRGHDARYLTLLSPEQIETVNRHLRNAVIYIERYFRQDGEFLSIVGSGEEERQLRPATNQEGS